MVSAVFDSVIFVRGLISPYGYSGRLLFERAAEYRLVVSSLILSEILEVIRRPRLVRKYPSLATRSVDVILALLAGAEVVEPAAIPAVSRDPKDDKFLATAALAGVDYLVSEDQDLLVLTEHEGVKIVDAATFLRLIEQKPA